MSTAELGTPENPYTHDDAGADRRFKWCRCHDCKRVAVCLPDDDFYVKDDGDPLRCESCYWQHRANLGHDVPASVVIVPKGRPA